MNFLHGPLLEMKQSDEKAIVRGKLTEHLGEEFPGEAGVVRRGVFGLGAGETFNRSRSPLVEIGQTPFRSPQQVSVTRRATTRRH